MYVDALGSLTTTQRPRSLHPKVMPVPGAASQTRCRVLLKKDIDDGYEYADSQIPTFHGMEDFEDETESASESKDAGSGSN